MGGCRSLGFDFSVFSHHLRDPVVARVTGALHKSADKNAVLRTYIARMTKALKANDMEVREIRRYGNEGAVSGVVPPIKKELEGKGRGGTLDYAPWGYATICRTSVKP